MAVLSPRFTYLAALFVQSSFTHYVPKFQRFPKDSWFPLTLAKPAGVQYLKKEACSVPLKQQAKTQPPAFKSRAKARSVKHSGRWVGNATTLIPGAALIFEVKCVYLSCWAAASVPEAQVEWALGCQWAKLPLVEIILTYAELDPSEEQGFNLNSTLFTPRAGSRHKLWWEGNSLARTCRTSAGIKTEDLIVRPLRKREFVKGTESLRLGW